MFIPHNSTVTLVGPISTHSAWSGITARLQSRVNIEQQLGVTLSIVDQYDHTFSFPVALTFYQCAKQGSTFGGVLILQARQRACTGSKGSGFRTHSHSLCQDDTERHCNVVFKILLK